MSDQRGMIAFYTDSSAVFKSMDVKSMQPRFIIPTRVMSCAHMKVFICFSVSGQRHGHEALKGMVGGITYSHASL